MTDDTSLIDLAPDDRAEELRLVEAARGGDEKAFRLLIDAAHRRMFAVTLSITGNRHDAEDAMQNALIALWRNLNKFEPRARFSTWAYRIASNAALQIVRSRRDTPDEDAGLDLADTASAVDSQVTSAMVVRNALATLAPEFREVLVLREYAGMNYADIAEHQSVPVQTVKSRLNRARTRLAEALREAGVDSASS